jgi:AcrR family transcriptional regulator
MSDTLSLSAPEGRREQVKRENRRAILDAARSAFAELGYESATVRDIIRRTNLSVGAFYNYFRSKEEVHEALSDDGVRRFRPILTAQYETAGDLPSYIRGAITAYFNFLVEEHETWTATSRETGGFGLRTETPEMQAVFDQVRASLAEELERGHAPMVDTDYLAAACIAIAREVGERMLERRPIAVGPAVEFAVQMILGGLPALPHLEAGAPA